MRNALLALVLVVIAVGVWSFYTRLEAPSKAVTFSHFMRDVEAGRIDNVTISGQRVSGIYRAGNETFHTYAPPHYEELAKTLDAQGILIKR